MMGELLGEAAHALLERKRAIASEVERRIYSDLKSYSGGTLPLEESHETVLGLIDFVIENLQREDERVAVRSSILSNVISFEEGIAARRVRYSISMIDLLRGVQILREEIWRSLRQTFADRPPNLDFFVLERRVNALLDHFFLGISEAYLKSQEEITAHHVMALEQWEQVVKSASSIELKIPCRSEYVAIVRLQAEAIARRVGYDEDEVHDIVYAVGEAADNAIEHGASEKGVDIHYLLSMEEFRVEITDYGPGFDPAGRGEEPPDPFDERGRGIFMMRSLVDTAAFTSSPAGTRVVLIKMRWHHDASS